MGWSLEPEGGAALFFFLTSSYNSKHKLGECEGYRPTRVEISGECMASGSEHTMTVCALAVLAIYNLNLRTTKIGKRYIQPRSGIEERNE